MNPELKVGTKLKCVSDNMALFKKDKVYEILKINENSGRPYVMRYIDDIPVACNENQLKTSFIPV